MALAAVVFDVDGTLVDSEQEGHRVAFNRAFEEMGLEDRWEPSAYRRLLAVPGGVARLAHYFRTAGVSPGEAQALATRLHRLKTAQLDGMIASGAIGLRPGVGELHADLRSAGVRLAVATTGSGGWVGALLGRLAPDAFEVVVTGSEVAVLKPDPACYHLALSRLALEPGEVVAVEDSPTGCAAALGAGLACVVVANSDTLDKCFPGAALVVSGFGGPPEASVVADPLGLDPCLPLRSRHLAAVLAAVAAAGPPAGASVGAR